MLDRLRSSVWMQRIAHALGSAEVGKRERWAIAIVLGTVVCLYSFGLDFILGRGPFWEFPVGDAQTHLIGYRYFVADDWHFPLLRTTMVAPPKGINIVFLDSIPLIALPGKLLAPLLGTSFVPYGWWMLAVYVLQAYFAIRLVRALGQHTRLAALAAAVFALTFHAFLARFYHLALNAHFIILWALCLYFELAPDRERWRFAARWAAMLLTALLVHPYLFAMSMAIFATALAHGIRFDARELGRRAVTGLAVLATLVLVGVLMGHVAKSSSRAAAACCFGEASHNLASLIVPNPGRSMIWSDTPGQLLDQTWVQWDGSMFLGFPVLLLIAIALVRSPRELAGAVRRHRALAVMLVAMLAFACSNRAYFLDRELWSFDVPGPLAGITGTFRASGRFAWPLGLMLVLGSLAFALRTMRSRVAVPLILLLTGVSVVEGIATMRVARANTRDMAPRELDAAALKPALAAHERVEQWPSYQCLHAVRPFAEQQSRELQFLAAEVGSVINGVRAGRKTASCGAERRQWRPFETPPGVIAFHLRALVPAERPASCRPLGIWVICTNAWERPELAALRALTERDASPPVYRIGDRLDFGPEKQGARYLDGQWSRVLAYYQMYVEDQPARLRLGIDTPGEYTLALELIGVDGGGRLQVSVNGALVGEVFVDGEKSIELALPHLGGAVEISFKASVASPAGFVGVRSVTLQPR